MKKFIVHSEFEPSGDQPQAIEKLAQGFLRGDRYQTLQAPAKLLQWQKSSKKFSVLH